MECFKTQKSTTKTLLQAAPKPHVLDDYTVSRVFEVFGRQKDNLWLFEEQLARWRMEKLSVGQRDEVDRLTEQSSGGSGFDVQRRNRLEFR